jgi:hypothetical protein
MGDQKKYQSRVLDVVERRESKITMVSLNLGTQAYWTLLYSSPVKCRRTVRGRISCAWSASRFLLTLQNPLQKLVRHLTEPLSPERKFISSALGIVRSMHENNNPSICGWLVEQWGQFGNALQLRHAHRSPPMTSGVLHLGYQARTKKFSAKASSRLLDGTIGFLLN